MDLTKDIKKLDCSINHERQEVDGLCINARCCQQPQFCYQCQKTIHESHFKDCMRFTEISQMLDELNKKLQSNKDLIERIYVLMKVQNLIIKSSNEKNFIKIFYNKIKLIDNYFQRVESQSKNIKELIKNKNYGELRNKNRIIKNLFEFNQQTIHKFTKYLMDFNDIRIKPNLEHYIKFEEILNDYIIYNIDFTDSTTVQNYSLQQLELISQPIQFIDQSIQTQKVTEKNFNFFEFGLNEDDSSQANEIPEENYSQGEPKIIQLKYQYHTQHFIEEIDNNNVNNFQEIIIVENLLQQSGIKKCVYNINDQNEFQFIDSSNEQISDQIQEFNNEQIIQQPVQIDQQNTNEEQNNLAYQEQNQLDRYLLSYDNQIIDVEQYHNQQYYEQNENMNQDLNFEDNGIILIYQIN